MKKITLVILLLAVTASCFSQTKKQAKKAKRKAEAERIRKLVEREAEGTIIFNRQNAFGFKLNTDGYGLFYEHGRAKSIKRTHLYWIELGEKRHPKEEKLTSISIFSGANPFIFGKINNLYFVKLGFAQQHLLGGKGPKNGVAISAIYGGGFSAGLLKPYFLKVMDPSNASGYRDVRYRNDDTAYFAGSRYTETIGSSGFTKGFGFIKFVPGFHGRLAVRFDYGRFNEVLSALEVGVTADYYTQEMPILVHTSNNKFFFNAYLALVVGKRR